MTGARYTVNNRNPNQPIVDQIDYTIANVWRHAAVKARLGGTIGPSVAVFAHTAIRELIAVDDANGRGAWFYEPAGSPRLMHNATLEYYDGHVTISRDDPNPYARVNIVMVHPNHPPVFVDLTLAVNLPKFLTS